MACLREAVTVNVWRGLRHEIVGASPVVVRVDLGYGRGMHTLPIALGSRCRGLVVVLVGFFALAVLLVGALSAQAQETRTSKEPVDFIFNVRAASASFTPIEGSPGVYKLVLRGTPKKVRVHELDKARRDHSFSVKHMMSYWVALEERFEKDPPFAVIRGSGEQAGDAVVVKLRDGTRKGSTITFRAEVESSSQVLALLKSKIGKTIKQEIGDLNHLTSPESMTNVTLHIDIPKAPGKAPSTKATRTLGPSTRMTCNGNTSNQLVVCWDDLVNYVGWSGQGLVCGGQDYAPNPIWYEEGFVFLNIGMNNLGSYFWHNMNASLANNSSICAQAFGNGDWYGVNPWDYVTYYASDNCGYFLAKWAGNGRCY